MFIRALLLTVSTLAVGLCFGGICYKSGDHGWLLIGVITNGAFVVGNLATFYSEDQ